MKKNTLAISLLFSLVSTTALAHDANPATNKETAQDAGKSKHSGGTDSKGCHKNHKTGDYHCHTPKKK